MKDKSTCCCRSPTWRLRLRSCPRPNRFRSRILASPNTPLVLEKPAPNEISPVERSFTDTSTTVLSRADPALLSISTRSKNPRLRMRDRVRRNLDVLKASPSSSKISRRITLSSVRTLPEIFTNSTKTRGPSWITKVTSIVRFFRSRRTRGRISTNAYPRTPTASVSLPIRPSTSSALYHCPSSIDCSFCSFSTSRSLSCVVISIFPNL